MQFVRVKFVGDSRRYDFKTNIRLSVGDMAVVQNTNGSLGLVEVLETDFESTTATAWVVSKVDMTYYRRKQERDRLRREVKAKIDAIVNTYPTKMELVAKLNPEVAELVEQYKELQDEE